MGCGMALRQRSIKNLGFLSGKDKFIYSSKTRLPGCVKSTPAFIFLSLGKAQTNSVPCEVPGRTYLFLVTGSVGSLQLRIQEVQAELIDGWLEEIIFHQARRHNQHTPSTSRISLRCLSLSTSPKLPLKATARRVLSPSADL